MILAMDIGNTNIKMAVFDGDRLVSSWRLSTNRTSSSDEYGMLISSLFAHSKISVSQINGIILSSVVPSINFTVEHMISDYLGVTPRFVSTAMNLGLDIRYENPRELGSDRICNAIAARAFYGSPCLIIDFGTATTFGALDQDGVFLGGSICPGIKIASEALVMGTSKLPHFELQKPAFAIGRTTVENLQSGLIYGYVGQVEYLVRKFKREMRCENAMVVATGGFARLVASETSLIDKIDSLLTLKGLRLIYERTCGK